MDVVWELILLLISAIVSLYFYFDYKAKYWQRRGVDGPKALPIVGNLLDTFKMAQNELEDLRRQKYGRVYGAMQGTTPVLSVADPDILKQMMITDFRVFRNHSDNFFDPVLTRMMNELKDEEWRKIRATISPAFTIGKIKAMQPMIEQCIKNTMKYLDTLCDRNEEFDIKPIPVGYTLDVIAKCVYGVNLNTSENPNDEFVVRSNDFARFKLWRALTKVTLPGILQDKLNLGLFSNSDIHYFTSILRNIVRKRREAKENKLDFITLMLNAEKGEDKVDGKDKVILTENDLVGECFVFFLAGFETTSSFLHYFLYSLAMNPEIQEKLFKELNEYFEDRKEIDFDSLNALPYFEAVCNETLRMYTPVTIFEHVCGENYKLGNISIEKGVVISLAFYALHHDPELFPNPHQFIPERFLPENKDNIKPYSFLPFGLGPRICIGNRFSNFHSKLFLANFVRSYEILKTKNTNEKPEYIGKFLFLTCKPLMAMVRRR